MTIRKLIKKMAFDERLVASSNSANMLSQTAGTLLYWMYVAANKKQRKKYRKEIFAAKDWKIK